MSTGPHGVPTEASLGKQAVSVLTRMGLELTPENFHLITQLLRGTDADLKRSFAMLRRPVSQADLTELAQEFLPQLFQPQEKIEEALALLQALPQIQTLLDKVQQALLEFGVQVDKAKSVAQAFDDQAPAALQHVLSLLARSTETHAAANGEALQALSTLVASLHQPKVPAVSPETVAQAMIEPPSPPSPAPISGQLSHGLGERAAMMSRLQALHSGEQHLDGYSLMLCRLNGFEAYRSPVMRKARDFLLDTMGQQASRMIGKEDSACWMAADEMGLLLDSDNEIHLTDVSQRLRRLMDRALAHARNTVKDLPALGCRFGCATALGGVSPAMLYSSARLALQRAELTEDDGLVINAVSPPMANRRYTAIYNRH